MTFTTAICLIILVGSLLGSTRAFLRALRMRKEARARESQQKLFRVCALETGSGGAVSYGPRRVFQPTGTGITDTIQPRRVVKRNAEATVRPTMHYVG